MEERGTKRGLFQGNSNLCYYLSLIQTSNSWHRRQMCCTVCYRQEIAGCCINNFLGGLRIRGQKPGQGQHYHFVWRPGWDFYLAGMHSTEQVIKTWAESSFLEPVSGLLGFSVCWSLKTHFNKPIQCIFHRLLARNKFFDIKIYTSMALPKAKQSSEFSKINKI